MRSREAPLVLIAPLGLGAALGAHALLLAIAGFGFGSAELTSRPHSAVGPVTIVEIALALWLFAFAVRDAVTARPLPRYEVPSRPKVYLSRLPQWAGCIAATAIATLFGMEYAESGNAALGLGWLGGVLAPGVIALSSGIATTRSGRASCRAPRSSYNVALIGSTLIRHG